MPTVGASGAIFGLMGALLVLERRGMPLVGPLLPILLINLVFTFGVAGIQTTLLAGDPTAAGPYTIALRVPAHTIIAPHTHRDDRSAVVVSGTWWFGYGPVNAKDRLKALAPGSFYTEPGGQAHFARTGDQAVVVYITGIGPTDTRYLDAPAISRPQP